MGMEAIVPVGAMLVAAASDIRERKIPNIVTMPLALAGIISGYVFGDLEGLKMHALGFAFVLGMFLLGFKFGVARGGDGKLAAAAGAWLGLAKAYPFLMAWLVFNAAGVLFATFKAAAFSPSRWWQEQRVSLQSLRTGTLTMYGAASYPGAVTIFLAYVTAEWILR